MTDRLDWNEETWALLDYIDLLETLLLPDYENYDYWPEVTFRCVTEEEKEQASRKRTLTSGLGQCACIFRERYNEGLIARSKDYGEFCKNLEIKRLLGELELDRDKFWLLTLFVNDYCKHLLSKGTCMKPTPAEQLTALCEAIGETPSGRGRLTYVAGRKKVVVESAMALEAIAEMISNYKKEMSDDYFRRLHSREPAEQSAAVSTSAYIAFFARIFFCFFDFQPQVRAKRKKGAHHSLREAELVCQLIYFMRVSYDEDWAVAGNDLLKSFLRQYKDYKYPRNHNSVYPDFLL